MTFATSTNLGPVAQHRLALGLLGIVIGAPLLLAGHLYVAALHTAWARLQRAEWSDRAYRHAIEQAPDLNQAIAQARGALASSNALYSDDTAADATARLSQSLKDLLAASGAATRSVELLPPQTKPGFDILGLSVDFSIDDAELPKLLQRLHDQRPWISVRRFDMTTPPFSDTPGMLWIRLKLSALRAGANAGG